MNQGKLPIALFALPLVIASQASGSIEIVTDPTAPGGMGNITRDTSQGLDFLDVPLSAGISFNEIVDEFGVGGNFESFRYATREEVVTLVNNSGFSPPLSIIEVSASSTVGVDTLSELTSLLGTTGTLTSGAVTAGLVDDPSVADPTVALRFIVLEDQQQLPSNPNVSDQFRSDTGIGPNLADSSFGSFLVRPAGTAAVPEPTMLVIWSGLAGCVGLVARRRR